MKGTLFKECHLYQSESCLKGDEIAGAVIWP